MSNLLYEKDSFLIRKAIFDIYKKFRNRHKEIVYHNALVKRLAELRFQVEKNKRILVLFHSAIVGVYVSDIVVNDSIIIELKCKPFVTKEDQKQFWEYLKSTNYLLGFLVNFGTPDGVEIFRRVYEEARKRSSAYVQRVGSASVPRYSHSIVAGGLVVMS